MYMPLFWYAIVYCYFTLFVAIIFDSCHLYWYYGHYAIHCRRQIISSLMDWYAMPAIFSHDTCLLTLPYFLSSRAFLLSADYLALRCAIALMRELFDFAIAGWCFIISMLPPIIRAADFHDIDYAALYFFAFFDDAFFSPLFSLSFATFTRHWWWAFTCFILMPPVGFFALVSLFMLYISCRCRCALRIILPRLIDLWFIILAVIFLLIFVSFTLLCFRHWFIFFFFSALLLRCLFRLLMLLPLFSIYFRWWSLLLPIIDAWLSFRHFTLWADYHADYAAAIFSDFLVIDIDFQPLAIFFQIGIITALPGPYATFTFYRLLITLPRLRLIRFRFFSAFAAFAFA